MDELADWIESDAMASKIGLSLHKKDATSTNVSKNICLYENDSFLCDFSTINECCNFLKSLPQFKTS
jgi:hypothetical protein